MRNRIWGLIGILWGGTIVLRRLFADSPSTDQGGAYGAGQIVGVMLGMVMVLIGCYYLLEKRSPK
jgi:hypothetical protein